MPTVSARDAADRTWSFAYDAASRITGLHDDGLPKTFGYDALGQVTSDDGSPLAYDAAGNRSGHTIEAANRLLSGGGYSYTYDNEGNRTSRTTTATGETATYEWDHRNQLTAVTFAAAGGSITKKVTYGYDGLGRRIWKDVDVSGDGSVESGERHVYVVKRTSQRTAGNAHSPGWH